MTTQPLDAYDQGFLAATLGLPKSFNPFTDAEHWNLTDWNFGYDDGAAEADRIAAQA